MSSYQELIAGLDKKYHKSSQQSASQNGQSTTKSSVKSSSSSGGSNSYDKLLSTLDQKYHKSSGSGLGLGTAYGSRLHRNYASEDDEEDQEYLWQKKYQGKGYDSLASSLLELDDGEEKDWLEAYAQQVDYDEKLSLDLDAYSQEIADLEQQLEKYKSATQGADFIPKVEGKTEMESLMELVDSTENEISSMKQYLTLATRIQDQAAGDEKYTQVVNNADFAEKSGYDSTNKEIGYQYVNADAAGRLDLEQKYGQYVQQFADHAYDSLTDEEKSIYNYYMNTGDRESAAEYLDYIEQTAQERKGTETDAYVDELVEDDSNAKVLRYAFMANAGLDQHKSSMQDLGSMITGDTDYRPSSATQYASQLMREDMAEDGKKLDKLGGVSTGQMLGDVISTTANMAPSILTSSVIGLLNPTAGATAGKLMMSGGAAGSGYREMINEGYTQEQARLYGIGAGAAEYFMEEALGGISKLGGASVKAITKWTENVDNALFKFALQMGGSGFSEGLEEGLTDVVTGWLKSEITNEDFYAKPADVLYSSLLGAATGALFEGPSIISDISQQSSQGREVKSAKGVETLKEMGQTSSDSVTRDLANRISSDSGNYAVGKLARKIESETHSQNSADIASSLSQKGMPEETAKQYGDMLSYMLEAGSDTEIQRMVMESDPVIGQTLREIQMPDSKVYQRSQNMSAARGKTRSVDRVAALYGQQADAVKQIYNLGQYADGTKQDVETFAYGFQRAYTIGRENGNSAALTEEIAPGLTQSQRELAYNLGRDAVAAEKAAASKRTSGKEASVHILNEDGSMGDAVRIAEISAVDGVNTTYVLEDGRTVSEDQLSFSGDNAVLDTVKDLGLDVETANVVIRGKKTITKADALVAHGIDDAYRYGSYGYSQERLAKDSPFAALLTEEMRTAVYNAGKNAPATAQKKPPAVKVKTRGKNAGIYYDAGGGNVKAYRPKQFGKLEHKRESGVYAAQVLQKLGIGVDFYFFKSYVNGKGERVYLDDNGMEQNAPNGWYDKSNGSIHIDLNAGKDGQGLTLFTIAHELTHFIEEWSPEKYKELANFLIRNYEKGQSMDELVLIKQQALSAGREKPVSYEEAYSEVIADSMEAMLADGNVVNKLRELKAQDSDLVARMKEFFDRLVKRITKYYQGLQPDSEEGQMVLEMKDQIDQIQQLFAEALAEAGSNFNNAMEQVIQAGAEPVLTEEIVTDGAVVTDGNGVRYSIRSMKSDIAEGKMFDDLQSYCNWSKAQVDQLKKDLTELVDYMIPFRDVLDLNETYGREERRFSPYKPNSDPLYQISMDFSTLCSKRLLTQFVIENLQLRENRPMTAEEQMAIRDMLIEYRKQEKGLQVACAMCYVEAARLKSPKQMQRWLNDPAPLLRDYFGKKNKAFNDSVKKAQADFKESRGYKRDAPKKEMKQADIRELNKIGPRMRGQYQLTAEEAAIVDRALELPNSTYLTAGNLAALSESDPVIYDAYTSFVRTATRSKSLETDEPYYYGDSRRDNGNGIIVSDSFIEAVNRENGMRFSSWSDWRIQHMLDYITAVIDNAVRGAAMHGYTKFPEEVRVLGKTGMMFNLSGVAGTQTGLNEDGSLSFSPTESIDKDEAVKLREDFPETAGLQCIGVGDDHIRELMKSDIIDYIIPYHVSGLNKALRTMADIQGWKDYTGTQHASIDHSVKLQDAADPEHWHEEPVFSEFFVGYDTGMTGIEAMQASAEQYRQMCHDRGLIPKFNQFYEKGNNYWKLLIDRKMINQKTGKLIQQKPVTPTFDFDEIKAVVKRHVDNYDSNMEARALNHIVENWDSIPGRIKDLKKGKKKAAPSLKAVNEVANQMLAAQGKETRRFSDRKKPGEYGGIREVLAKKGLDELSGKLGDRFPLSAKFDETMRNDGTELVMEDVAANSVVKGRKESAYKVGRKAFISKYGVKTRVHIDQMGIDADLYADVANESISKAIGQTNEQSTLDVIPHVGDILSNSILMGIERIAHTDNKSTALYGYRLYNLYWYVDGNKKTPHALVCTVVQDLNKAEGYVFKNIENVTIGRGLPGSNAGMSSSVNGDTYTVAQLYDAVKRIDRNEGGLKYSDADRNYLFSYTERDDGVAYQDRSTGTSNRALLAGAFEELAQKPDEREFLQKYRENVTELDKQETKLQELRAQIQELSFSKGKRDTQKLRQLQEEATKTSNRIDIYDKRLLKLETAAPLQRVLERERVKVKRKADADRKAAIEKFRKETKAAYEGVRSDSEVMEREFIRLMRAYEKQTTDTAAKAAKDQKTIDKQKNTIDSYKADMEIMNREFIRVMKGYETAERKNNAFWEGEFKRLMREYEASGRKVDRLEAKIKAQRESVRANVDSRRRTVLRNKIRKDIRELRKILDKGNKKRNVKQGMQDFVSKTIATGEILFADLASDTDLIASGIQTDLTADERTLLTEAERYVRLIAELEGNEDMTDVLQARKKGYAEVLKQLQPVLERERIRINSTQASSAFDALVEAYRSLRESQESYIAIAFNQDVLEYLEGIKYKFSGTLVKDMSQEQLQTLHDCYKMVMTTIRDVNKAFVDGRSVQADAEQLVKEFQDRKIPAKKLGVIVKNLSDAVGWNYEKLYYALDRINSPTLKRLFGNLADSENITMRDVQEAKAFQMEAVEKYHYNDWDIDKKMDQTFLDNNGKEFHLTLGELLALYAYSRREGADRHIEVGGFTFGETALTNPEPAATYKLTPEQVAAISDLLTSEQKSFAEAMQKYLSKTMGAKGNEVTMKLYGIEMFGEENYFPLHIAGEYKAKAQESQAKADAGFQSMTNAGFTKARNTNATAPIVLEDFMTVWADHVNEMSRYHGAVPALEDIRRVMNYSVYSDATQESVSVTAAMTNAYGKQAVKYFDNLYREANSGAVTDKMDATSKKLLSLFRKNSVAYSASVIIQQPASIFRAKAIIDGKYFGKHGLFTLTSGVLRILNRKKWNAAYEEMMKYAPGVTMAKEIGGFDTNTGSSIRGYLLDTDRSLKQSIKHGTQKQKAGAVMGLVDDNVIANLPNVADKLAWIEIWEACKRETVAKNPKLHTDTEVFRQKVGQRFTEVIQATQVYDSMFSKSPMLKSRNLAVQYAVSFMNEPNTVANMAEQAVRDLSNKEFRKAGKTVGALVTSIAVTNLLKSIIYAMRDEDEDETFWEKYLSAVAGNLMSDVNPLNFIPIARDVWSIWEGYDVERSDMAIVADAISAIQKLQKLSGEDISKMTEEELEAWDKKVADAQWRVAETLSPLAGIPLKNIRREILSVINTVKIRDLDKSRESTELSIRHAIEEATGQSDSSDRDKLYEALLADDQIYVERLKEGYESDSAYHSAVKQALRDNDSRIWEAAVAWNNDDLGEYLRLCEEIVEEEHFDSEYIYLAAQAEASSMLEKESDSNSKVHGKFTDKKFGVAMGQNNTSMADIIREDLIDTAVANGKSREEAEQSVQNTARTQLKELFETGDISASAAENMLVKYGGYERDDASEKVSEWKYETEYPELDGRITYSQYKRWEADGKSRGISLDTYTDVVEYRGGDTSAGVRSQADVAAYIDSMQISTTQKDALWCCFWSENTLYKNAPWH